MICDSMNSDGLSESSQFRLLLDPGGIGLHGLQLPDSQRIRLDAHAGFDIQSETWRAI